jgi:hypothetical protein
MAKLEAKVRPSVTISAVITRADGTVEDLGVICQSEPVKQSIWKKITNLIKGGKR